MTKTIKSYFAPFEHKVILWRSSYGNDWDSYRQINYDEVDIEIANGETLRYTAMEVDRWENGEIELWLEDSMPLYYIGNGR
jgi:hypothetical protein